MATRILGALDTNPLGSPSYFDPLALAQPKPKEAVAVVRERTPEGWRIVVVSRNRT